MGELVAGLDVQKTEISRALDSVNALAGTLAKQRTRPIGVGTMPTGSPIFVGLLTGVVLLVGALSFFPALALGPVAEALTGRLF